MVKVLDVIYGVVKGFKGCMIDTKHYLGNLPENYKAPCFLYTMAFHGASRETKYVKDTSLDLQIIYFASNDGYSAADYGEKLKAMDQLKMFLDTFLLEVGDRWLKFDYRFDESDNQLTINIDFRFKECVINVEEAYDVVEHLIINGEEV